MPRDSGWHQKVKEILKEIGEEEGYDVSESENEILLASRFKIYDDEKKKIHNLMYKPDVVWKDGHIYRAIFEIEYLNPRSKAQLMDKRKYAIGSLMLGFLAMVQKSVDDLVFITNNEELCVEIAKFVRTTNIEHFDNISYISEPSSARSTLTKNLKKIVTKDWKI
jgi:hypothetical protein